ncbi:MAG: hypothetical protein Q8N99_05025 [Nanoarchaeota archaeon]|nr:hypothetical protein [Nanoarchaeota archaeon]
MKRELYIFIVVFMTITNISAVIASQTLEVCPTCNYTTIQSAVNDSHAYDTIKVLPGIYNENQIFINKSLTIIGNDSIVDGGNSIIPLIGTFHVNSSEDVVITGFTIRNPSRYQEIRAGVFVKSDSNTANIIITNNIIFGTNNPNEEYDYGIYAKNGKETLKVINNIIKETGGNNIFIEKHIGQVEVLGNIVDMGAYGRDSILFITDDNVNINSIQKIAFNIIDAGTGNDLNHEANAITIISSYNNSGKFSFLRIYNNTINNIQKKRGGIGLYNNNNGDGKSGEINQAQITSNIITGSSTINSYGIKLSGLATNATISYNNIKNVSKNFIGEFGIRGSHYPDGIKLNFNSFENKQLSWHGSSILNAKSNWWGSCEGPISLPSTIEFIPWLGACIRNKAISKNCVVSSDTIILYANVTSKICIGKVIFEVKTDNGWHNYTGRISSGIGNFAATISNFTSGNTVFWRVYADDCYNHWTKDNLVNEGSFYVNKNTNLSILPPQPNGYNSWYVSRPTFTLSNGDASIIYYRWDGEGPFTYTGPFGLDNTPNNGNNTGGILRLSYWSNVCSEQPISNIIKIDFNPPEIKNMIPLDNITIYNERRPIISAYFDEVYGASSGIDKSKIIVRLDNVIIPVNITDSGSNDATAKYLTQEDFSEGMHTLNYNASDKAGNNIVKNYKFYINNSLPDIILTISYPININYSERSVIFNITSNVKLASLEYVNLNDKRPGYKRLCTKCNEYGNSRVKRLTLLEGGNELIIKATDMYGNTNESSLKLFIDSKKPIVSFTSPTRNKYTNGSNFYMKYSEDNLVKVKVLYGKDNENFEKDLSIECNVSGKDKVCYYSLNLTDIDTKKINYYINMSDPVRSIVTRPVEIIVDTNPPIIEVKSPVNSSNYGLEFRSGIPFDITSNEKVRLEFFDKSSDSQRWISLCASCDNFLNRKRLSVGGHELIIRATDKAGNYAEKEIRFNVII